jgi:hypothetical protein
METSSRIDLIKLQNKCLFSIKIALAKYLKWNIVGRLGGFEALFRIEIRRM